MKRYHVVPKGDRWQVRSERSERATKVFDTKERAVQSARKIAQSGRDRLGVVVVHNKQGMIQSEMTYGGNRYDSTSITLRGRDRLPPRNASTGSFTTRKSTAAIGSNVEKFSSALERLAKK